MQPSDLANEGLLLAKGIKALLGDNPEIDAQLADWRNAKTETILGFYDHADYIIEESTLEPGGFEVTLNQDWCETERGNVMLSSHELYSQFNAWIALYEDVWLEISYRPENYPALLVSLVRISEDELFDHLVESYYDSAEWCIDKLNLSTYSADDLEKSWADKQAAVAAEEQDETG